MTSTDKASDFPARNNGPVGETAKKAAAEAIGDVASQSAALHAENSEGGDTHRQSKDKPEHVAQDAAAPETDLPDELPQEHGGQAGLDPTRYGDWEKKGRCTDF